jgi:hypothetical protein
MHHRTGFSYLVCAAILPLAGACNPVGVEPIVSGSATSTASAGSTGSGGSGGGDSGATTSSGTGGATPGACEPGCGAGEICLDSSCHALVVLDTSSAGAACAIALDASRVYWTMSELRSVPRSGGPATSFKAWVGKPTGLAVDDTYVYVDSGDGVGRGKKDGSSGITPFAGLGYGAPTHMAADGTTLYYLTIGSDTSAAAVYDTKTAGPPVDPHQEPDVFATGIYGIGTVALDASSVYFWGGTGLVKEDKATHAQTALGPISPDLNLQVDISSGIVVDGDTVYFSTAPAPGQGAVVARLSGGGGPSTVVIDGKNGLTGVFTVDATSVYFMTFSGVMKVAKTGGPAELVVGLDPPSPFPSCMASDDKYIYWVDGPNLLQLAR